MWSQRKRGSKNRQKFAKSTDRACTKSLHRQSGARHATEPAIKRRHSMVASLRRPPGSAAAAEGALQHATARLPTDRGPPRRLRSLGSKFPPQILPPAHTRPLTPGKRSPVNGIKSCSARADRMRPILSRLASHAPQTRVETPPQICCRSLCWEQTPFELVRT